MFFKSFSWIPYYLESKTCKKNTPTLSPTISVPSGTEETPVTETEVPQSIKDVLGESAIQCYSFVITVSKMIERLKEYFVKSGGKQLGFVCFNKIVYCRFTCGSAQTLHCMVIT